MMPRSSSVMVWAKSGREGRRYRAKYCLDICLCLNVSQWAFAGKGLCEGDNEFYSLNFLFSAFDYKSTLYGTTTAQFINKYVYRGRVSSKCSVSSVYGFNAGYSACRDNITVPMEKNPLTPQMVFHGTCSIF